MLRFGFIGLGAMGMSHVHAIATLCATNAEVAAICSTNPQRIEAVKKIAPNARVFANEEELMAAPLDGIFVSTPNFTHLTLARKTLDAGKHLFLEKPCGITLEECSQLNSIAAKSDRVVMIGHEFRYSPYFQKIKSLITAGEIGQPRMVWCREFRGPFQKKSQDWIQDRTRSGGMLVDKNSHHFDLMNWWADSRPTRVAAFGGNAVHRVLPVENQVHDHATVSFEYANHVRGTLNVCLFGRDFPKEELEMGVVGDEGSLQTRIADLQIAQWRIGKNEPEPILHSVAAKAGQGWGNHLGSDEIHLEFVNCILEKRAPLASVAACLDGTRLAIGAEESIRQGRIVEL